jgi:hypothetical protein
MVLVHDTFLVSEMPFHSRKVSQSSFMACVAWNLNSSEGTRS